jgi:hypothetical protein
MRFIESNYQGAPTHFSLFAAVFLTAVLSVSCSSNPIAPEEGEDPGTEEEDHGEVEEEVLVNPYYPVGTWAGSAPGRLRGETVEAALYLQFYDQAGSRGGWWSWNGLRGPAHYSVRRPGVGPGCETDDLTACEIIVTLSLNSVCTDWLDTTFSLGGYLPAYVWLSGRFGNNREIFGARLFGTYWEARSSDRNGEPCDGPEIVAFDTSLTLSGGL